LRFHFLKDFGSCDKLLDVFKLQSKAKNLYLGGKDKTATKKGVQPQALFLYRETRSEENTYQNICSIVIGEDSNQTSIVYLIKKTQKKPITKPKWQEKAYIYIYINTHIYAYIHT
jgi:hypothetical protein